jgi:hypothetical protein
MGAGLALLGAVDPKAHRHATIASIGVPIEGEHRLGGWQGGEVSEVGLGVAALAKAARVRARQSVEPDRPK